MKSAPARIVTVVVLLLALSATGCEEKRDFHGRSGEVVRKNYVSSDPPRWFLYVKKSDGTEIPVSVDQVTYHEYDEGDSYP